MTSSWIRATSSSASRPSMMPRCAASHGASPRRAPPSPRWARSAGSSISIGSVPALRDKRPTPRATAADLLQLPRLFNLQPPPLRLTGERVLLRPPERGDWQSWAELRGASRDFLTPWEPSWPSDALTRAAFRRRIARYAMDWRTDQGYSLFLFRKED